MFKFKNVSTASISIIMATLMASLATSCATIKIEKEKVAAVKKIAIVGYAIQQTMPNSGENILERLASSKSNEMLVFAGLPKAMPHADNLYGDLARNLQEGLGFKIISRRDLASNPHYRVFLQEKTSGAQPRPLVASKYVEVFTPDGILEPFLLNTLKLDQRQKLIKSLGVDAIAMATIKVDLVSHSFLGVAGTLNTVSKMEFKMFDGKSEDPIWHDLNADGKESEQGVKHAFGFANPAAVHNMTVETGLSANKALIARYKK